MERRWGNRVCLDLRVRITREGETIGFATLHEASVSGAFLRTPFLLRNLTRVTLEISSDDAHSESERLLDACVVRQCPDGVGVEWCEFGPEVIVEMLREPQHQSPPLQLSFDRELSFERAITSRFDSKA